MAKDFYIGFILLNRHLIGEAPAVAAPGGFMSDITTPDRAYEAAQLATLSKPVMLIDMPGHGVSSPHNGKQIYDLCIKRDANSSAEPMLDAVHKVLGTNDPLNYFGISHGGHLALKMTELDPIGRVQTVFGLDLPGTKKMSTIEAQFGYVVMDNIIGRRRYLKNLHGTKAELDYLYFLTEYQAAALKRAQSFISQNPGLFALNLFSSINASPSAINSWRRIMAHKSTKVAVVTGEKSHVSSALHIEQFIDSLSPSERARSTQTVILDEDHNLVMTYLLPRAVGWAEEAYNVTT